MVIFPYVIAAPLLFAEDPSHQITLGTLVQMSNSFDKVFSSLSVVSENWGEINEFRSVIVRLRQFEAQGGSASRLLSSFVADVSDVSEFAPSVLEIDGDDTEARRI